QALADAKDDEAHLPNAIGDAFTVALSKFLGTQVRRDDGRPPHLVAVVDQQVEFGQPASVLVGVLAPQVVDGESVDLASFVPNHLTSGSMQSRGKVPCLEESSLRRVELNIGNPCPVSRTYEAILPGSTAAARSEEHT